MDDFRKANVFKIGEICDKIHSGGTPSTRYKEEYYGGNIPWLRSGEINFNSITNTETFITEFAIKNSSAKWIRNKSVLIALTGATVARTCVNEISLTANQSCCALETNESIINYKYLYYYLASKYFEIKGMAQGALTSLNLDLIKKIIVPVPKIKVQEEIVKILDSFTNLIDALNEEQSLRQKQFEYYREKLLTFDDKSVYTTLGKVGKFTRGNGLQKKDFTEYGFPCIHYGQIHTSYNTSTFSTISYCSKSLAKKLKKAKYGDLLIATTSEDVDACCKAIAWLGEGEVAYSGDSYCFSHNENPKYMAYLFQSNMFYNQKKTSATGAKVIRVSGDSMSQFILPIPSLAIQQSIVEKLDAFESLISSLKEEVALRQKQYEYYREKLLTFN